MENCLEAKEMIYAFGFMLDEERLGIETSARPGIPGKMHVCQDLPHKNTFFGVLQVLSNIVSCQWGRGFSGEISFSMCVTLSKRPR